MFWLTTRPDIKKGSPLRSGKRSKQLDQIILHESVTSSRAATERVLKKRRLSVHFMVDRDGTVTQHASTQKATFHAGSGHNSRSIGVEMVSPYYGARAKQKDVVVDAVWAHKKRYILPSIEQAEACFRLVQWLCLESDVPFVFPCVNSDRSFRWGRSEESCEGSGVIAHHRFHHADGLFFEHYCASRKGSRLSPDEAYAETVFSATSMKRRTTLKAPKDQG
jgi:hypothetical protein